MFISKSKYLSGLQCSKLLWFYYNAKNQFPPVEDEQQRIFDQGHEIGELAKTLFPNGIEVSPGVYDFASVTAASQKALAARKPLFEAGFDYKNAFARVDVLNPVGDDAWDIIEIKSSTALKDINIRDIAFQRYTYEGAGLKIKRCYLVHLNNQYVKRGAIEADKLLTTVDVTEKVNGFLASLNGEIEAMAGVIALKEHPPTKIGRHCNEPYSCPLQQLCWKDVPEDSVFTLYRAGMKAYEWYEEGYRKPADLPEATPLSKPQTIQVSSARSGNAHVDAAQIQSFLKSLAYPLYFLDFETFATAIPLFDGSRPYQQIPFQFSLHVVKAPGAKPQHHSFLADGTSDPRRKLLDSLIALLGEKGSIMAYNAAFEKGRLSECCEALGEHEAWLRQIEPRIVDLLKPFREFHYYHPAQNGSASMKAVLPALVGKGYESLEIQDGNTASAEFLRVTFGKVSVAEKKKVRANLEKYCGLDTLGMVWIVDALCKQIA